MGGRLTLWLVACLLCTASAGLSEKMRNSSSFPVAASPDWRLEMGERVSPQESAALREEVREMVRSAASSRPRSPLTRGRQFHFTYDNYMRHAFPKDELKPMSCAGTVRGPRLSLQCSPHPGRQDTLGSYALTLVDALDTIALMGAQAPRGRVAVASRAERSASCQATTPSSRAR